MPPPINATVVHSEPQHGYLLAKYLPIEILNFWQDYVIRANLALQYNNLFIYFQDLPSENGTRECISPQENHATDTTCGDDRHKIYIISRKSSFNDSKTLKLAQLGK